MLDLIDERILVELSQNARISSKELARILKISPATVRRRIRRLIKDGVMAITANINPQKVGLGLVAVIQLNIEPEYLESTAEYLTNKDEVAWMSITTGRFDIYAHVRFVSIEELYSFLREELPNIKGLKNNETSICLQVRKAPYIRPTKGKTV